ncbi:MAG: hypothetical protein ACR2P3_02525 [Geminicoccaceae bacterium]
MAQHVQIDGVGSIAIVGGNVRTTFYSYLAEPQADGKQAAQEPSLRVAMSVEAFVKTYQAFRRMAEDMEAKGIIKRQKRDESRDADKPSESPAAPEEAEEILLGKNRESWPPFN